MESCLLSNILIFCLQAEIVTLNNAITELHSRHEAHLQQIEANNLLIQEINANMHRTDGFLEIVEDPVVEVEEAPAVGE